MAQGFDARPEAVYPRELPSLSEADFVAVLEARRILSPQIEMAIEQAKLSHGDQARDNGESYLTEHIFPVANEVILSYGLETPAEEDIIGALLHDAIEDDPDFTAELCLQRFGQTVTTLVQVLTKQPGENQPSLDESVKMEINRALLSRIARDCPRAMRIKLADRYHNLRSVISIRETNPAKYQRYLVETGVIFLPVAKEFSPYFYDKLRVELEALRSLS
ncbi:MAG: HD domain-containing protein [Patescibacteria group bacterium]